MLGRNDKATDFRATWLHTSGSQQARELAVARSLQWSQALPEALAGTLPSQAQG